MRRGNGREFPFETVPGRFLPSTACVPLFKLFEAVRNASLDFGRAHTYYIAMSVQRELQRRVTDLPLLGRIVQLVVVARRFRCDAVLCGRQITERFPEGVLAPSARRTTRLDCIVHHLGLALGGRPAALFA